MIGITKKYDKYLNNYPNSLRKYDKNIKFQKYNIKDYKEKNVLSSNTNNEHIDLSIVIPVYNAELYISDCLESLINQKTQYKYEVILINDGSTDDTQSILNKYSIYPFFKIFNQKNGGISVARNIGLKHAQGNYIGFIDNDDWVSPLYIETLLDIAYKKNADIVKCGFIEKGCKSEKIFTDQYSEYNNGLRNDILKYNGLIWGGIQSRAMWKDICFPEKYWYEDMITRFLIYRRSKVFIYLEDSLYYKREHINNASKKLWKANDIQCLDQLFLIEKCINVSNTLNIDNIISLLKVCLDELGLMFYYRISKKYRKSAFIYAAKLLHSYFNPNLFNLSDLNEYQKMLFLSIWNNDYSMWKKVIKKKIHDIKE